MKNTLRPRVRRGGPLHWTWTCPCRGGTPVHHHGTWADAFRGAFSHATWGMHHVEQREWDPCRFCGHPFTPDHEC